MVLFHTTDFTWCETCAYIQQTYSSLGMQTYILEAYGILNQPLIAEPKFKSFNVSRRIFKGLTRKRGQTRAKKGGPLFLVFSSRPSLEEITTRWATTFFHYGSRVKIVLALGYPLWSQHKNGYNVWIQNIRLSM